MDDDYEKQCEIQAKLSSVHAEFAINLLREILQPKTEDGGVIVATNEGINSTIVSPISVAISLGILFGGAKGQTAKELARHLLPKDMDPVKLHEYLNEFLKEISNEGKTGDDDDQVHFVLDMANRIYSDDKFTTLPAFDELVRTHYNGQFEQIRFEVENPAEIAQKINAQVEACTRGKIRDLVRPEELDPRIRLIIINAVYFCAKWQRKFNAKNTKLKTFHVSKEKKIKIEMLRTMEYKYFDYFGCSKLNADILRLSYYEREAHLFILLPRKRHDLSKVLAKLDGKTWIDCLERCREARVRVTIPKFKLNANHQLIDLLQKLGIKTLFNEDEANLGGICTEWKQLCVGHALQKAFIEVNEEGSEASAASEHVVICWYNLVGECFSNYKPPPRIKFVADHPFAFFLTNGRCDKVIFAGIFGANELQGTAEKAARRSEKDTEDSATESEEDDGDKKDDGDKAGEKKRTNKGGIFRRLAQIIRNKL